MCVNVCMYENNGTFFFSPRGVKIIMSGEGDEERKGEARVGKSECSVLVRGEVRGGQDETGRGMNDEVRKGMFSMRRGEMRQGEIL